MRILSIPTLTVAATLLLGAGAASAQSNERCDDTFEKLLSKLSNETIPSMDKWNLMSQLHEAYEQCRTGDAQAWSMVDSRLTRGIVDG